MPVTAEGTERLEVATRSCAGCKKIKKRFGGPDPLRGDVRDVTHIIYIYWTCRDKLVPDVWFHVHGGMGCPHPPAPPLRRLCRYPPLLEHRYMIPVLYLPPPPVSTSSSAGTSPVPPPSSSPSHWAGARPRSAPAGPPPRRREALPCQAPRPC